ncbi:hypothetical protein [Pseudomonas syringae]|uniref:hypothetical protein n=1 Tax=Pseudomonas syringae TaxID=317 RepID=UPI0006E4CC3E|nr:hypothetical protein [Pseudomonas syringae]KPZ34681.1 hypothetical protein AN901_205144 [Pseudomonas syringae pv. theae]GKQ33145.1 hypothetical protein PSTH68_26520 [Pseudomonas syringae pv. theae]
MKNGVSMIRIGLLLPGGTEVGEGANRPMRCMAATHSGEIAVIAKKLSLREIAVEVVCAALGRAAGLPIPEPLLLVDDEKAWHYGSADVGHPNLAQYVTPNDSSILEELTKWPPLLHAACFDELIANPDRNDGNLLYDGAGFFLIDHGMCIPHGMSATDTSEDYHNNQLLDVHAGACADELSVRRAANAARGWSIKEGPSSIELAGDATVELIELKSQGELLSFLRNRVAVLGDLLHDKIKPSQQGSLRFND